MLHNVLVGQHIQPDRFVVKYHSGISPHLPSYATSIKPIINQSQIHPASIDSIKNVSILDGIYIIEVPIGTDIRQLCNELNQQADILYAEPLYFEELLYVPNDPAAQISANQAYLQAIRAYQAWDVNRSNASMVIGIIDTGIDLNHPDLAQKLYRNVNDPVNGLDDDNNGYIDDEYGYDFADRDNNANADRSAHGTHVAGIAGAHTDNAVGIAGVGFHASISPLKIFRSADNLSANSYEAILYAANNQYDIATLSWGSINTFSQFHQDIINYAVLEKNVILIGAAGNTPNQLKFYPAAYENVLSVAATNLTDQKAGFSTFDYSVDISAPGQAIYSTQNNNTYGADNGTSHAVPQVAGVAALVKAQFPQLSALQIMARIRSTADTIYYLAGNAAFQYQLGKGRLNAERALKETGVKGVNINARQNITLPTPYFGDTATLQLTLQNYLAPLIDPLITVKSLSTTASVILGNQSPGFVNEAGKRELNPIRIKIDESAPSSSNVPLLLEIKDGTYRDYKVIEIQTAPDQVGFRFQEFSASMSGDGRLLPSSNSSRWNATFKHIGLGLGNASETFANNMISNWSTRQTENGFSGQSPIKPYGIDRADFYAENRINAVFPALSTHQQLLGWENTKGSAIRYVVSNTTSQKQQNINLSWLINWSADYPSISKPNDSTMLISSSSETVVIRIKGKGTKMINASTLTELQNSENFSQSDKWSFVNQTINNGFTASTNSEWVTSVAVSNINIDTLSQETISILIATGATSANALAELNKLESHLTQVKPRVMSSFLSCEGSTVSVSPGSGLFNFYREAAGNQLIRKGNSLSVGPITKDTIIYAAAIQNNTLDVIRAYPISATSQLARFEASVDTLFLNETLGNRVEFRDMSILPVSWRWDFGNGNRAEGIQHPSVIYTTVGSYKVTLAIENAQGCTSSFSKTIHVLSRPDGPYFDPVSICPGEDVTFQSAENEQLRLYATPTSNTPLDQGNSLHLEAIWNDTTVYISRITAGIESKRTAIQVTLKGGKELLSYLLILDSLQQEYAAFYLDPKPATPALWRIDENEPILSDTIFTSITKATYQISAQFLSAECAITLNRSITFLPGPEPMVSLPPICKGDNLTIKPANGMFFGFYANENTQQAFFKGTSLNIPNIENDSVFFIRNLDGGLASAAVKVELTPISYSLEIIADPDTLILTDGFSAQFAIASESTSQRWFLNNQLQSNQKSIRLFFANEGIYQVKSWAQNAEGCSDETTLDYVVLREPLPLPLGMHANPMVIYPNPTSGAFRITNYHENAKLVAIDVSGKKYPLPYQKKSNTYNIQKLSAGVYMLYDTHQNAFIGRVIKSE